MSWSWRWNPLIDSPHRFVLLMYWKAEPKSFSANPDLHISLNISWARVPRGVADSVREAASWDSPRSFSISAEPNPPCKRRKIISTMLLSRFSATHSFSHLVIIRGGDVIHDTWYRVVSVDWPASTCCRAENLGEKLLVQTETDGRWLLSTR